MTEVSKLKYIQWRPIGVCDRGEGKERKAKMFSKADLATVIAPGVDRNSWREHPEVLQLIQHYAQDVAGLSGLTAEMESPEVADIQLVGAVLGHDKTPNLNRESSAGRVQFFQVNFRDGKDNKAAAEKRKRRLKILLLIIGTILGAVLLFLLADRLLRFPAKSGRNLISACSSNRQSVAHSQELRKIRQDLFAELGRLPAWSSFKEARLLCAKGPLKVSRQERHLLQCLLSVRKRTENLAPSSRPDLKSLEACAQTLCRRGLAHLSLQCKRL